MHVVTGNVQTIDIKFSDNISSRAKIKFMNEHTFKDI